MPKKNIIVSSLNQKLYTTVRLLEEAKKLKHSPIYINPYLFHLTHQKRKLSGLYFHRTTGTNYDDFDLTVTKSHEINGMKITNPLDALKTFRSKDLQSLFLEQYNLSSIPTLMYRGDMSEELENKIEALSSSHKFILKMNRGNQGIGVNFLDGIKSLRSVLETFHALKDQKFLIQPYVEHKKEWRLFIIKGEIIACLEKTLLKEDFRGNAKRSSGKFISKIPNELKTLALDAFSFSNLDYAGVDILLGKNGEMMILELNPVPGFEQAEMLSGINIARELISLLK